MCIDKDSKILQDIIDRQLQSSFPAIETRKRNGRTVAEPYRLSRPNIENMYVEMIDRKSRKKK